MPGAPPGEHDHEAVPPPGLRQLLCQFPLLLSPRGKVQEGLQADVHSVREKQLKMEDIYTKLLVYQDKDCASYLKGYEFSIYM